MHKQGFTTLQALLVVMLLVLAMAIGYWFLNPPAADSTLRVGVVLWGHHDAGLWDPAAANAVLALQGKYAFTVIWSEEIDITQIEIILHNLAQTCDIVYLTTDEFEEACNHVAPLFPDVYWIIEYEAQSIASDRFPSNVVAFNAYQAYQLSFLAGAVAAKITQTNTLGVIQAIPGPRDTRLMSAPFRAGAHFVNEDIEVLRTVVGAYVDPFQTRNSVAAFAEAECDVIFVGMDDESGTLEAQEQGIYTLQEYLDITAQYPETILGCTVWNWTGWLDHVFDAIVNDRFVEFRTQYYEMPLSLADRSLDIPTFGTVVSQEVRDFYETLRSQILTGEVEVPIISEW